MPQPPLEALAYTSSAQGSFSEADLEALLARARERNRELGVTGALLYHDGCFFQYFEGPPASVAAVYERIRLSPLHRGLIELMRAPAWRRTFSDWQMGFTHVPASTLLQLSQASWLAQLGSEEGGPLESEGMSLLRQFWDSNRASGHGGGA